MTEKVRLIIWDLDETFWHGTLTEGGIRIRPEVCDLVKTLAARGIMSSICSKNNLDEVKAVLEREGVWEYFIFPSVNWDAKGPRIAAMVEMVQLRAPTVMFIDDNPLNLEEVRHFVPGIQVQSHDFIPEIAASPLFEGKDDTSLSRLAQYKVLESRKQDEHAATGDTTEFLRKSDIRVYLEHDIVSNLDRAIELINRTNQLNYTKRRLPEDPEEARRVLTQTLGKFECQAGLVRVIDRYGDYGYVGFYLATLGRRTVTPDACWQTLQYYCFSCRTLGMYVEQWLYEHLQRPQLDVVGEVLTDLSEPRRVDWIRQVMSLSDGAALVEKVAPEIRVHGGCEANALAHYLAAYTDGLKITGNFASSGMFVRLNAASLLLSACDRLTGDFAAEAGQLGLPYYALAFDYFADAPAGTVFVFNGGLDQSPSDYRYQHKTKGWEIRLEPNGLPALDYVKTDDADITAKIASGNFHADDRPVILRTMEHVRDHYHSVLRGDDDRLVETMAELCDRIPVGSMLTLVLGSERERNRDGVFRELPWVKTYNTLIRKTFASTDYVLIVGFDEVIRDDSENYGHGHFERTVYWRLAERIAAGLRATTPKQPHTSRVLETA